MTFNYKDGSKTVTLAEVEGSDLSCFGASNWNRENHVISMVFAVFVISYPIPHPNYLMRTFMRPSVSVLDKLPAIIISCIYEPSIRTYAVKVPGAFKISADKYS